MRIKKKASYMAFEMEDILYSLKKRIENGFLFLKKKLNILRL